MEKEKVYAIIVAAGSGTRFGGDIPKQFLPLGHTGLPVVMHAVTAFMQAGVDADNIRIVLNKDMTDYWLELCRKHDFVSVRSVHGGRTRFHSVKNAVRSLPLAVGDTVLIHDGARPLVTPALIRRVAAQAQTAGSAVPVVPVTDSLRRLTGHGLFGATSCHVSRDEYVAVQTPQGFTGSVLAKAYETDYNEMFTDDASVVSADGNEISIIAGEPDNIKITTPRDITIAEALIDSRKSGRSKK